MSEDLRKRAIEGGKDLPESSSEEVEIRAIGDATDGISARTPKSVDEAEQDIEYREKRELAIDERVNADPSQH